jgi:DNA-binding CsgD family transcriptional regulator
MTPPAAAAAAITDSRWERQLLTRARKLKLEARDELGLELEPVSDSADVLVVAASELAQVATAAVTSLDDVRDRDVSRIRSLTSLALRSLDLQRDVDHQTATRRAQRYAEMQRGLDRLRSLGTSADLLDSACQEVVNRCGFSRAMLTRVEAGEWLPWMAYFPNDRDLERRFVEWMNAQRFPASALGRDLTGLHPVLVRDAIGDAGTFKPMIEFSRTQCYVAAPITPAGRMVGVLYADRYPTSVDEHDRDVLWAFTEDFGRIYERIVLIERMRSQRSEVHEAFELAEQFMSSLAASEIQLEREPDPTVAASDMPQLDAPGSDGRFDELLTKREIEVLELMVRGASNATIAERLIIKEGTVKSHVKHILRKLDAINRAEAISRYMGRARGDAR